jgi:hypothetical protein
LSRSGVLAWLCGAHARRTQLALLSGTSVLGTAGHVDAEEPESAELGPAGELGVFSRSSSRVSW